MFNTNSLILENLDTTSVFEQIAIDENYFAQALVFVTEMRNEVITEKKALYNTILEAGDSQVIVTEAFDGFFTSIKNIIKKFIEFIKKLFNKFSINMHKMVGSDKYIIKNRAALRAYDSDCEFEMEMFKYTFSDVIPKTELLAPFTDEFIGLSAAFKADDGAELQDAKELLARINSVYGSLKDKLEGTWYDTFRGEVIGKVSITKDQFGDALIEVFRNDESFKTRETITSSMIDASYSRIDKYKKSLNDCKNTKDRLEREYNAVNSKVEKLIKVNHKDNKPLNYEDIVSSDYDMKDKFNYKGDYSSEVVLKLDAFTKLKCDQITEMSAIHALAFAAKLDAIKECHKQDQKMLYATLQRVNKKKGVVKDGK